MTIVQTMTSADLRPAVTPTLYFIGVTTGRSSIQQVFPRWADELGLTDAVLQGIDLPLHAPAADYRRVVEFIAADPLSLGALVTTHKIDLYTACADLFDEIDPFARLMGETSCISKRDGLLVCHAKDPISSGLALDAFVPAGHWAGGADALCMGAGGSTIAISWYLSRRESGADRPRRIVVTNRSEERLDHIRGIHRQLDTDTAFEYVLTPTPADNDRVLADLAAGSLVVNATGLGKDAPGSPLTDAARFPGHGVAWDLNYRGDLVFLDQARAQEEARALHIEDGWIYFLHGWTQVIAEVFHIDIPTSGPSFDRLGRLARSAR
ncbi:shikimate dehydrogenase family protein [Microbacterium oleivorans]|uniref:shikimate dehydrogenase family protein n=1 Tax=Microbacterium oleivorans TaxID=273677 RepID=UPI00203BFFA6|nr:shikimate dehydrogenase [Microbacterium oleivorans]MCM3694843.1 shikimate dehydrogenase [Microbacterium oleivorans]